MAQPLLTCALAMLIVGAASVSRADTITVTGGWAGFDTGDPPGFHLVFDRGELFGGYPLGGMVLDLPANSPSQCFPALCQAGDTVSLAADWKQQSTMPGVATIDGQEVRPFYDLSLSFKAGAATLPALSESALVNVPFTMDGTIELFFDQARSAPLLSAAIAGQGTASAEFLVFEGGWAFLSHDFFFEPAAAPIPEPGTLTLLATGAAAALVQRKRSASRKSRRSGRDW